MHRFLFALLLSLPSLLAAQQLRFSHIDTRQGLSQNSVHALLEDHEGFIWAGTQDGLCRFDGYGFTVFRNSARDTFSLTDNFVTALAEDKAGNIWVGTRSGLCVYQKHKNRFLRYYTSASSPQLHQQAIRMAACNNGVTVDIVPTGRSYAELKADRIEVKSLTSFAQQIWKVDESFVILNNDSLYSTADIFSRKQFIGVLPESKTAQLHFTAVAGVLTFSYNKQVFQIQKDRTFKLLFTLTDDILAIAADYTGRIWIATFGGLFIGDSEKHISAVKPEPGNIFSLNSEEILCLLRDHNGLMWVGTSGSGINICDPGQQLFDVLNRTTIPGFPVGAVWSYLSLPAYSLVGTEHGVVIIPEKKSTIPNWTKLIPEDIFATQLCFDRRNRLWVGTRSNGLVVIDTLNKSKEIYTTSNSPLLSNKVFHISCVQDSEMVVATDKGCYRINTYTDKWLSYQKDEAGKFLSSSYIISTTTDKTGRFWLAHPNGLTSITYGNQYRNFRAIPGDTNALIFDITSHITETKNGKLWITTLGGGVSCFDPQTNRFTSYSAATGLPNDVVYVALEDRNERIWMSTNDGLVCLDPKTGYTNVYTLRDGLPATEFVQNAGWNLPDGTMAFGCVDGLIRFNPQQMPSTSATLTPVLSMLYINNQPQAAYGLRELMLDHETRNVSFAFTAMNFRVQDRVRYSCMLEGFDESWQDLAPGQRLAVYTNLPFGDYVFKLRVRIGNGPWQEHQISLPVHIVPPFWLRTWFFVLIGILVLLLAAVIPVFISRQRFKRKMRVLETERKIHLERERISRDLHDNIGAQITYMVSTLDFLSFRLDKQTVSDNRQLIHELGDNARQTMDQLRETIWAMNQPQLSVGEFAEKLRGFLRKVGNGSAVSLQLESREADEKLMLQPARVLHLYRIAQEAVNNAVKHAQANQIIVHLKTYTDSIFLCVEDDGCGIAENGSPEGHYGLDNMRTRASELGATLQIETAQGKGTKITVTLSRTITTNDVL